MFRNVMRPAESPYWYKKSNMNGTTNMYENMQPAANKNRDGSAMTRPTCTSAARRAGDTNATDSRIITGTDATIPSSAAMYTCEKNAWPGAVCINSTPSGTKCILIKSVIWAARLSMGSGTG